MIEAHMSTRIDVVLRIEQFAGRKLQHSTVATTTRGVRPVEES